MSVQATGGDGADEGEDEGEESEDDGGTHCKERRREREKTAELTVGGEEKTGKRNRGVEANCSRQPCFYIWPWQGFRARSCRNTLDSNDLAPKS